jgi:recombination protein RecA
MAVAEQTGRRAGDDRQRALDAAISQIERAFGKGSLMRLGQGDRITEIDVVSTGSLGLDIALGVGGLPRGRIIEIYGPESSGKTTLTLHTIAEMQKLGGTCAFVDAEHALDPGYARKLGVKLDELLISQPDTGEQALEIADTLIRSGAVDMIVVDSVAALVPKAELEGEMGDQLPGLQARLMSQALRKLTASINRSKSMLVFTNQIRSNSMPPSASMSGASAASRTRTRPSATRPASRWRRTRWRRRSGWSSSTSCMARAFPRPAS